MICCRNFNPITSLKEMVCLTVKNVITYFMVKGMVIPNLLKFLLSYMFRQVICAVCRKPIKGRCITAMFRKFHPECFVCRYVGKLFLLCLRNSNFGVHCNLIFHMSKYLCNSYCQQPLKNRSFKEEGDKPYCQMCFDRLFGWNNVFCRKIILN